MSSAMRMEHLEPGQQFLLTNDTRKPLEVVLQTQYESEVRMTLPIGGELEFTLGEESGVVYILEREQEEHPVRAVPKE
ncbi:hypothetical protein HC341_12590 [Aquisalimonas sp. 2447]|uniref:hypothetical protein n=1 Tax=Aquisalimonas sp. 2447 TaxID=2740807 RepID=UPI0014323C57|nr:hypothetical protein [Aquisalimonas sp. 2447]QIT55967.1 hypothetical protein HC341_12590 [Aquisalimonas sp. 2447]